MDIGHVLDNSTNPQRPKVTYSNRQLSRISWVDRDSNKAVFACCGFNVTWLHPYWYVSGWRTVRVLNQNLTRDKHGTLSSWKKLFHKGSTHFGMLT